MTGLELFVLIVGVVYYLLIGLFLMNYPNFKNYYQKTWTPPGKFITQVILWPLFIIWWTLKWTAYEVERIVWKGGR